MPPDSYIHGELDRRITDLGRDIREGLREIKDGQRAYVLDAVYRAEQTALLKRISDLEEAQVKEAEQRRDLIKWMITGIAVPIALALLTLWLNYRGPGPG